MERNREPAATAADRVQTGLRMDRALIKVLKGLAEYLDTSFTDVVEGIILHALEDELPFKSKQTRDAIAQLRALYGLNLRATDSHRDPTDDA